LALVAGSFGGIEAEAAILGNRLYFIMPRSNWIKKLNEKLPLGSNRNCTWCLTIANFNLENVGVGRKNLWRYFGSGLANLFQFRPSTIGNMSPEVWVYHYLFPDR